MIPSPILYPLVHELDPKGRWPSGGGTGCPPSARSLNGHLHVVQGTLERWAEGMGAVPDLCLLSENYHYPVETGYNRRMALVIHHQGDPVGVLSNLRFISEGTVVVERCLLVDVQKIIGLVCSIEQDGKPLFNECTFKGYDAGFYHTDPDSGQRTTILEQVLITYR